MIIGLGGGAAVECDFGISSDVETNWEKESKPVATHRLDFDRGRVRSKCERWLQLRKK